MKKEQKKSTEARLLELLKQVLPKATHDPKLANDIYAAVQHALQSKNKAASFDKFCERVELPDLEPATVAAVQKQFADSFGEGDVVIKQNKKDKSLSVEVAMPDGSQFHSEIKVRPLSTEPDGDPEVTLQLVPFPVCLPGDPELVWMLARRENLTTEEAGIVLHKLEDEFWASKAGQKMLQDRVERCFPEFMSRAPAKMFNELGLKRHYKLPEAIKTMRPAPNLKAQIHRAE